MHCGSNMFVISMIDFTVIHLAERKVMWIFGMAVPKQGIPLL